MFADFFLSVYLPLTPQLYLPFEIANSICFFRNSVVFMAFRYCADIVAIYSLSSRKCENKQKGPSLVKSLVKCNLGFRCSYKTQCRILVEPIKYNVGVSVLLKNVNLRTENLLYKKVNEYVVIIHIS